MNMGSEKVSTSLKKSNVTKGIHKENFGSDEELSDVSGSEMDVNDDLEEGASGSSDMDDSDDEPDQGEGESGSSLEEDEDKSIDEEEDEEDNMSGVEDGDESDSDLEDAEIDGDEKIKSSEGVDFSDSDNGDVKEDDETKEGQEPESNDVKVAANPAWANALAKILRTQKPARKKAVVLSKARTIPAAEAVAASKTEGPDFEVIGEGDEKPKIKDEEDIKPSEQELIHARRQRLSHCRVKQDEFDYNRERALTKIATRGVVQLFNAVRGEQKNLGNKLAEAHSTRMGENLLKSIDKNSFLEHLTGKIKSHRVEDLEKKTKKEKVDVVLPKSWDELSKSVESGRDLCGWDRVIEIKDEPDN